MSRELEEDPSLEMGLFRSPGWPYGAFPRGFAAKHAGEYRVRFSARAVLQHPDFQLTEAKQTVPMTFRSRRPTNHDIAEDVKSVGGILEIQPGVHVYETTVSLIAGQTVEYGLLGLPVPQVDAEGKTGWYRYPPFPPDGQPGVAFQWIEIEGPIPPPTWPPASHQVLFDDLGVNPAPSQPRQEASRLLRRFIRLAARGPVPEEAIRNFEQLVFVRLNRNDSFAESMLAGYQAFLCSDLFLYLREPSNDFAIADRLAHFLTNTRPDARLVELAGTKRLRDPATLRREANRLIDGSGCERFVKSFAGYWLNLRYLRRDDPDKRLYPEYQLDEYLIDSLERETLAFITAMVRDNLPIRNLVEADFVYANERLAKHYQLEPVAGATLRRVTLPKDSPLGGLLTQGAILEDHGKRRVDFAGPARRLDHGPYPRRAAIATAARRGRYRTGHPRRQDDSRPARDAHQVERLCLLPCQVRSRRTCTGELRRSGPLADSIPGHHRGRASQWHRPYRS